MQSNFKVIFWIYVAQILKLRGIPMISYCSRQSCIQEDNLFIWMKPKKTDIPLIEPFSHILCVENVIIVRVPFKVVFYYLSMFIIVIRIFVIVDISCNIQGPLSCSL